MFSPIHFPFILFAAFVLFVFGFHEWEFRIQPLRIPKEEISAIVDELIEKHGPDAEKIAYFKEDAAWRRSHIFEQGTWRRVRKELWHRYEAGEWR